MENGNRCFLQNLKIYDQYSVADRKRLSLKFKQHIMPRRTIPWFEYVETDKLLLQVASLPLSYLWRTTK